MPFQLLNHLKAIRATPPDQSGFAAFEKRPDMLAAGADKDALDAFDFDNEPALDEMIGRLGGEPASSDVVAYPVMAPTPRERLYRRAVDDTPQGFAFAEDMVAGGESQLDNLASRFLERNADHFTGGSPSSPTPELRKAIQDYASTAQGRLVLTYAGDHDLRQDFDYGPMDNRPEQVPPPGEVMLYNPAAIRLMATSQSADSDGFDTADFSTVFAHGVGHTRMGREALGLPQIRPGAADGPLTVSLGGPPTPEEIEEELRATALFENPYRRSKGFPLRRSYDGHEVSRWSESK